MYDLILKNGVCVSAAGELKVDLAVSDGKIVALLAPGSGAGGRETLDCQGQMILPGMVDMHFHCRVPGRTEREDFDTATMAAAAGGITTLVEMPIAKPSPHTGETFRQRRNYAERRAVIDFGLYGAGATRDADQARELAEAGATAFKIFLHDPPQGREDEFAGLCAADTATLYQSFAANRPTGLLTAVHCEDNDLIRVRTAECAYHGPAAHRYTRPPQVEELAILRAGLAAGNGRVHICHLTSLEGLRAVCYLQEAGVQVTAETCPQYLFFDASLEDTYGAAVKVNPPLRELPHRQALLDGLRQGAILAVASDHAPFLLAERTSVDLLQAPSGIPGAEMFGPLMIDGALRGLYSFPQVAEWTAAAPARLLGFSAKGGLAPGQDADLLIVDPQDNYVLDPEKCFTRSKSSLAPFAGRKLRGRIRQVLVRGQTVMENNVIRVSPGYGRFLPGKKYHNV